MSARDEMVVFYANCMYFMQNGDIVDIQRDGTDVPRKDQKWTICNGLVHRLEYLGTQSKFDWFGSPMSESVQTAYKSMLAGLILEA